MSSAAASPARTSASPERAPGIGGERSGLWAEYARLIGELRPATSSWRTSQLCLLEDLSVFLETWPRSGTMRNGTAFQLPPLVPLTDATGSGSWPTPTARDTRHRRAELGGECAQARAGTVGTDRGRLRRRRTRGQDGRALAGASDAATRAKLADRHGDLERRCWLEAGWWLTEPDVGRVAHGVPARVDRLRSLGNAVVPQIAEWLGERVMAWRRRAPSRGEPAAP